MSKCEIDIQLYPKEEEEKNGFIRNHKLNLNLNVIQESEEHLKNKEEEEQFSEEETLGYKSNYQVSNNGSGSKENINVRKSSTLSTTISHVDNLSETNLFLPPNNIKTQNMDRKTSFNKQKNVFFGRERLNSTPITNYYEGLDLYLRGLQPEKNGYQKSNNFIEKEIFFKEKNISFNKFKSFDLSEQKKFNSNQILSKLEENKSMTISEQKAPTLNLEKNKLSTINYKQNNYMQLNTKNCTNGKFDMPFYYFGCYYFDCKYI